MTIYFKSRGSRPTGVEPNYMAIFLESDIFVVWLWPICFQLCKLHIFERTTCVTSQLHQTNAPWPFISKVVAADRPVLIQTIWRFFWKVIFLLCGYDQASSIIICIYSNEQHLLHHSCIRQRPHDHLFQRSWQQTNRCWATIWRLC